MKITIESTTRLAELLEQRAPSRAAELVTTAITGTPHTAGIPVDVDQAYAGLVSLRVPGERPLTDAFVVRLHDILEARRVALATPEPSKS